MPNAIRRALTAILGADMTEFLNIEGGTLAYDLTGTTGPLVVLAHGMGDSREAYRFLVPALVASRLPGRRGGSARLRGVQREWTSYTRTDIASDLVALVRHLGGPAVLVGHSIAGGAATIAAATAPELVTARCRAAPFTRKQTISLGDLRVAAFRRGMRPTCSGPTMLGSTEQWAKYLDVAYPGTKPADWDTRLGQITTMLCEPGRMKALQAMGNTPRRRRRAAGQRPLPGLVVQGSARPRLGRPAGRGRGHRRRPTHRPGPLGDGRRCRALPARPVPCAGGPALLPFLAGVRA